MIMVVVMKEEKRVCCLLVPLDHVGRTVGSELETVTMMPERTVVMTVVMTATMKNMGLWDQTISKVKTKELFALR